MLKDKTLKILNKWIKLNSQLRELNSYIYNETELFEEKNMMDYRENLFNFFAGKITRFTKDENKLKELLSPTERKRMYEMKIMED